MLRALNRSDAAFVLELLNEPAFIANIGDRGVRTHDDALRYIEAGPRASYATHGFGHYAVALQRSGELIGICGLRMRDGLDDPDLGFAFLQRHWSRGYAREAAGALLDYYCATPGLAKVLAICTPTNSASIAVLEKLGFRFVEMKRLPAEQQDLMVFAFHAIKG